MIIIFLWVNITYLYQIWLISIKTILLLNEINYLIKKYKWISVVDIFPVASILNRV